jgi:hypothetical protein
MLEARGLEAMRGNVSLFFGLGFVLVGAFTPWAIAAALRISLE